MSDSQIHRLQLANNMMLLILAFSLILGFNANAQDRIGFAFVDVNVIPMDTERVMDNQTVIVEGDRIVEIGPVNEIDLAPGIQIIESEGMYLMPGLADMHTHFAMFDPDPGHLILYLAQGTTTVRSVAEAKASLAWRDQIKNNDLVGPSIYSAGPVIVGNHDDFLGFGFFMTAFRSVIFLLPLLLGSIVFFSWKRIRTRRTLLVGIPSTLLLGLALTAAKVPPFMIVEPLLFPEFEGAGFLAESKRQAAEEVLQQHDLGVDLVKLYDGLPEDIYRSALAAAKEKEMYVISHLVDQIPLNTLLSSGIDEVAHIDEFNSFHWAKPSDEVVADFKKGIMPELDYASIPRTAALVKENDIAVVSNISLDEVAYKLIFDTPSVLAGEEYKVIRPDVLEYWRTQGRTVTKWKEQGAYRKQEMPFFKELIKAMHDLGVIITTGTDCSSLVEGAIPENIHRELELLVEAGLSNYEALEAGTKNAGYIVTKMGRDGRFGTIEIGQRADLILLAGNPLDNVSHTRERVGVMARGKWHKQKELEDKVADFVASY